jgi:hypothetical protein
MFIHHDTPACARMKIRHIRCLRHGAAGTIAQPAARLRWMPSGSRGSMDSHHRIQTTMPISSVPNLGDPFAPAPLPGEEPGVQLNEIPDPPPEENN